MDPSGSSENQSTTQTANPPDNPPPLKKKKTTTAPNHTTSDILCDYISLPPHTASKTLTQSGQIGKPLSKTQMTSLDQNKQTTVGKTQTTSSDQNKQTTVGKSQPITQKQNKQTSMGNNPYTTMPQATVPNPYMPHTTTMAIDHNTPDPFPDLTQTNPWIPEQHPSEPNPADQQQKTNTSTDDKMDTQSNATVESLTTPKKSYSNALTTNLPKYKPRDDRSLTWCNSVAIALAKARTLDFDTSIWDNDTIVSAFNSPELLQQFFLHKIQTNPTQHNLPNAIKAKFDYLDTAFFKSFAKNKEIQPQHQKEFNSLLQIAIEKYKRLHNVQFINKFNRDQIYSKLKTKLALDYICNLDFVTNDPHTCTRIMTYCLNFARISCSLEFEDLRSLLNKTHSQLLIPLPQDPLQIDLNIQRILPFPLPIQDRKFTRATVLALRKIFTFEQLPDKYFLTILEPLPDDPSELNMEIRDLFPITDRSRLPYLSEYRKKLMKYYIVDRIPPNYFNLPEARPRLPSTPQELNSSVRHFFPCNPIDASEFRRYVDILREHYSFKRIPNDYFIQKKPLPTNPHTIKTSGTYTFPITDTHLAKEFVAEIQNTYKFNIPLPLTYMTANPTNKPPLPDEPNFITEVNLTLPISSPKALVDTARLLREHYFFHQIPTEWIEIRTNPNPATKPPLPFQISEIQSYLEQTNLNHTIQIPITQHKEIERTITLLRDHFNFQGTPIHLLNLPNLPDPHWDILDNYPPQI